MGKLDLKKIIDIKISLPGCDQKKKWVEVADLLRKAGDKASEHGFSLTAAYIEQLANEMKKTNENYLFKGIE